MGWASGSYLAEDLWRDLKKLIPKRHHPRAAKLIVDTFESNDADDWDVGPRSLYHLAYPEHDVDE